MFPPLRNSFFGTGIHNAPVARAFTLQFYVYWDDSRAHAQTMNFFLRCKAHQAEKGPFSIVLSLDARISTGKGSFRCVWPTLICPLDRLNKNVLELEKDRGHGCNLLPECLEGWKTRGDVLTHPHKRPLQRSLRMPNVHVGFKSDGQENDEDMLRCTMI